MNFLYDFSALIIDDILPPEDRFLSQVAVAGEIECSLMQDNID